MMYYLLLTVAYAIAVLPFRLLYILSDILYLLVYYVIGYRKQLVIANLSTAFPEKTPAEIRNIARQFYKSFCDQWLETLKLLTISNKTLNKRFKGNWDVFETLHAQNKNVYALLGHRFNWEWANVACNLNSPQQFAGIYLHVRNKAFDKLMLKIRRRTGSLLIPANSLRTYLKQLQHQNHIIGFIADQSPGNMRDAVWFQFMNRPAPFINGAEKAARLANATVVYANIYKLKRGYYEVRLEVLVSDARKTTDGFITQTFVDKLSQELQAQPYNWLWTHKRWKHQPEANQTIHHL